MNSNFKEKRIRNPRHLHFIRSLPCCFCGLPGPCEAHHENEPMKGSKGIKVGDNQAVPLCVKCHYKRHAIGRVEFWYDLDPMILSNSLYRCFLDYGVWERESRALMAIDNWK